MLLIGIAPLASAFLASWIADAHGCLLNEGGHNRCIIGGSDWGNALYTMFVLGWLMLLTIWLIPVGLVLAIVGIVQRLRGPRQPSVSHAPE
jgi:hypothetical protein